jgi:uncharacterized HAD superfamily protein
MEESRTETYLQKTGIPIGVDIDDTSTELASGIHPWVIQEYELHPSIDPFTTYDFTEGWGCSRQESIDYSFAFYRSQAHMNLPPVKGAVKAITALAQNHPVYAITARPIQVQEETLALLAKHYPPGTFAGVYFTGQFIDDGTKVLSKLDICRKFGIQVMVEDSLRHAMQLAPNGVATALLDYPWNQTDDLPENAVRFTNWEDIYEWILAYEKKLQKK